MQVIKILASPGVTYADLVDWIIRKMSIDCWYGLFMCLESIVSIVDNIAIFKILLIDGAKTVSTALDNSKMRFRKLPVILITFGRKKYMLFRIYIESSMSVTLKSPSWSIPGIPQVVFDF
jgi:hypothetical protein